MLDVATNPFSSYRKREARKGRSLPEVRSVAVSSPSYTGLALPHNACCRPGGSALMTLGLWWSS